MLKKLLSILMVLAMLFSLLPASLAAEIEIVDEPELIPIVGADRGEPVEGLYVNPLYRDVISEEALRAELASTRPAEETAAVCTDAASVVAALREGMKAREEAIRIEYSGSESLDYWGLFEEALAHTGEPTEGDYIALQFGGCSLGGYSNDFTYTVSYYTTAAQEAEMDTAVAALLTELDLAGKSDYQKVLTTYSWLCDNITYDYDNLEDTTYLLKHTAYAALINRTAVCQGYAVLLYRLLLSEGVDSRVITSETHAWNIVQLGSLYYNADSTWDAGRSSYVWFLLNMANFSRDSYSTTHHAREEQYTTAEFMAAYPMSETDYTPEEEPQETAVPEYLTVNGEVFRLCRGLHYEQASDERRVVVGENGGKFYALDVSGDSVTATLLTQTEAGLSGDVAVYSGGMRLDDGRMIYIRMTDEETGAAELTVGTPSEEHQAYWIDFGSGSIVHRQYCCDYQPGAYKPYGNWLWFLTFRDGSFGCSERGTEYSVQFYSFLPEDTETYVYFKVCEHENKEAVAAVAPDCLHFGHSLYYECPDCGLKIDPTGEYFTARTNGEGEEYYDFYSLIDFYTSPALGHDYDPATGICSRCGEKAPVYEKITEEAQLMEGRRYLLVDNETGLALEVSRSVPEGARSYLITTADCTTIATTALEDGKLAVYGTGGAAFRLTMQSPYPEEELMGYPAEIDGGFSLTEDYSWEFDHPLSAGDLAFRRDGTGTIEVWDPALEDYVTVDEAVLATGLCFSFLSNGDVGARFFDGMHPIIYDPALGFRLRDEWVMEESWDEASETYVETEFPTGVSLYGEVIDESAYATAEITEVSNYSHYSGTSQYYEGAFVVWKEHVFIDGTPIQVYNEESKTLTTNITDEELAAMGVTVAFFNAETGKPALIDYDGSNINYYTGPARIGSYYVVVTQTVHGITREISERVSFEVLPTMFTKVTNYQDVTTGARWYLYSIMGEVDGQLYVMAMPSTEGTIRAKAIPVWPDEDGLVTLGYQRENVFCMRWEPGNHSWNDRRLLQLVTGTGWDLYFGGGNGSIWRGGGWTGDDGFYLDVDEETAALELFEPHMGHGSFMLVKDVEGNVFFTRAMWSTGHANPELGEVTEYPVYLYWNQTQEEPPTTHSYEFLDTPYDKVYDGEPIPFDPNRNVSVDGGKTSWAELEKMGTARIVWREWQGKELADLEESPVNVGMYQVVIQELDGKDWADALAETFSITEAEHTHTYGEPVWTWAEDHSSATAPSPARRGTILR